MTDAVNMFQQAGAAIAASAPATGRDRIISLADEYEALDVSVKGLEEALKAAKARQQEIKTKDMPDAMAQIGSGEWTSEDKRVKVKMDDFVSGSLPKDDEKRKAAIEWLEANGGGSLLKTEVQLQFGKSEHNMALDLVARLKEEGHEPIVESGVHPQTLASFARERLRKGETIDTEVLGLFTGRVAKITVKDK